MKPLTVYLRQGAADAIEVSVDDGVLWQACQLSPRMTLGGHTLEDLQSFLYGLIDSTLEAQKVEQSLMRQRTIGRQLHRELFGHLPTPPDFGQRLHVVPRLRNGNDAETINANREFVDFVCRVPWTLLTREDRDDGVFLLLDVMEPVAITVDAAPGRSNSHWSSEIKLPPFPRVLLVIPDVAAAFAAPTQGDVHEAELRAAFASYLGANPQASLEVVRSFDDFTAVLTRGQREPHIIYFYGHGKTDGAETSFLFEGPGKAADWRSCDEIRNVLDRMVRRTQFPPVVWLNACLGAAAESGSALSQLSPVACSVIATRTVAAVSDARSLGTAALPMIVIGGLSPPSAIRNALHGRPLPVQSARWASTVVSVQYDSWTALAAEGRDVADGDATGDFPMRLDRVDQLERCTQYIQERLAVDPAPLPIVWHGAADQGLAPFETLLKEQVDARLPAWTVRSRQVDLQQEAAPGLELDRRQHFLDCIFRSLAEAPVDAQKVPGTRVRNLLRNIAGPGTLLMLSHGPFEEPHLGLVRDYVAYWRDMFSSLAPPGMHLVLGFGLYDGRAGLPPQLADALVQTLGPVPSGELARHMAAYHLHYNISPASAPSRAQILVEKHGGRFDHIRRELERHAGF